MRGAKDLYLRIITANEWRDLYEKNRLRNDAYFISIFISLLAD